MHQLDALIPHIFGLRTFKNKIIELLQLLYTFFSTGHDQVDFPDVNWI